MAEFTPITTQEELNAVIQDRLNRANAKHAEQMESYKAQYADYEDIKKASEDSKAQLTSLKEELNRYKSESEGYEQSIKDKDAVIAKYERDSVLMSVAMDKGIPIELANRLTGDTREELEADADKLLELVGTCTRNTAPIANVEHKEIDGVEAAFRRMNPHIKF